MSAPLIPAFSALRTAAVLCFLLNITHSTAVVTVPPATRPHTKPADPGSTADNWIEPYNALSGGAFVGSPCPFNPDPIANYVWSPSVDASQLQVVLLPPNSVTPINGTDPAFFQGYASLTSNVSSVTVSGPGILQFYWNAEIPAWLEFDSPDLLPTAAAASIILGLSEYNQVELTNLGWKSGAPKAYPRNGYFTYRLETNPQLFEGVRYGWLTVNAAPATPWHITAFRAVAQYKPTNWGGAFNASGDDMLTRIWYACAWTVKANLLSNQIGAILIYRGDRYSWTGDAHVAQATAMVAFGDFPFVYQNINLTKENCNGIESYCLYFVLSVCDYYAATNDSAGVEYLFPDILLKLEHANTMIYENRPGLGFYGWDDRLGSGFANSSCAEAESAYRFLAIRTWYAWARVLTAMGGQAAQAAHFTAYADAAVNATRAAGGRQWYSGLGLYASSDAINAGFASSEEMSAMISLQFNDSVNICGLSLFNTYYVLEALSVAGELDRGHAVVHMCWDYLIQLGATTVWEVSRPDWANFLSPHDPIPDFESGYTSMAHPWASGAAPWTTAWLLGVRPSSSGYATVTIAPHIAGNMSGVQGTVPTPHGDVRVSVAHATAAVGAYVDVVLPASVTGVLRVSELLAARLGVCDGAAKLSDVWMGVEQCGADAENVCDVGPVWHSVAVVEDGSGPVHPSHTGQRVGVATLALGSGRTRVWLGKGTGMAASGGVAAPNPFPTPVYPATFLGADTLTSGSWVGKYGKDGYVLFSYDKAGGDVTSLPSYTALVAPDLDSVLTGTWATNVKDPRALQNPADPSGLRSIGCTYTRPTFVIDVLQAAGASNAYQFAVYVVDYDANDRKQTVEVMDRWSLKLISPVQYVSEFGCGVWLVWQYAGSVRLRFNFVRGSNAVVSAIAFDPVA